MDMRFLYRMNRRYSKDVALNAQRPGDVIITLVAKQFLVESSPFSESLGRKYCAGTVLKKKPFNSLAEFRLFCCQSIIGKYAATKLVAERGLTSNN